MATHLAHCHRGAWMALVLSFSGLLHASPLDTDRAGGRDHPLVSRFEGSSLYMFGEDKFASVPFVFTEKSEPVLRTVEGRVSNRFYFGPPSQSALEIFRNYQQALKTAGFTMVYACETAACVKQRTQSLVQDLPRKALWANHDKYVNGIFDSGIQPNFHFLSAQKATEAGPIGVQLGLASGGTGQRMRTFLQIVEPVAMETGKVRVDAGSMAEALVREGKVTLSGVLFDSDKAVLKDESMPVLNEMAKALQANAAMKVYIVGHTDNQGTLESNLSLSQRRAEAVADVLVKRHRITADRLLARGVADLSPVASHAQEEGRARNRRVEMVVR